MAWRRILRVFLTNFVGLFTKIAPFLRDGRFVSRYSRHCRWQLLTKKVMTMPAHFVRLLSLVGILFILLGGAGEAYAQECPTQFVTFGTSALRIPANAKVGDTVYDSTMNFTIPAGNSCMPNHPRPYVAFAYLNVGGGSGGTCMSTSSPCSTSNPSIGLLMDIG